MTNTLRRVLPVLLFPLFGLFFCNDFSNPYDSQSPNYVSDSTLVRYITGFVVDTTIVFDTVIHVDTVFHVDSSIHVDTSFFIYTVTNYDTIFDTIPIYDSIGFIDTLTVFDTAHFIDTLTDTVPFYDSIGFVDSVTVLDTVSLYFDVYDTVTVYDTATVLDTIHSTVFDTSYDTLSFLDTVHFLDTVTIYDTTTIFVYDTTVVHDTILDTVFSYDTRPLIRLISYPDSTPLSSYTPDSQYQVTYLVAGIDPAIITSTEYRTCGGSCIWHNDPLPCTRTFSGPTSEHYIKLVTDSGTFVDSFTLFNRYQQPTSNSLQITAGSFAYDRNSSDGFSSCTLYTQDPAYGSSGVDFVLTSIFLSVQSSHTSCGSGSYWEFYWSWANDFSTSAQHVACGEYTYSDPSLALEDTELSLGLHTLNTKARCCASPSWSDWYIVNIYVLAGPKP